MLYFFVSDEEKSVPLGVSGSPRTASEFEKNQSIPLRMKGYHGSRGALGVATDMR